MANGDINTFMLDVFADTPFTGNPACICVLPWGTNFSEDKMKRISAEVGCTAAFLSLVQQQDNYKTGNRFKLRWFTSKVEIKLCGHATLGTGSVLTRFYDNQCDNITFLTSGGELVVRRDGKKTVLELPVGVSEPREFTQYSSLLAAFGDVLSIKEIEYCESLNYIVIVLNQQWTRQDFESWKPDIGKIHKDGDDGKLKCAIVTMKADHDNKFKDKNGVSYDYVCRAFGPWLGAPEDPVTGSAHTILARYWSLKLGKSNLYARQCSQRGGDVNITVTENRVELKGFVTPVLHGKLTT